MSIDINLCESSYNSFRFMGFYSQRGGCPRDIPEGGRGDFFIDLGRGVWYEYKYKFL